MKNLSSCVAVALAALIGLDAYAQDYFDTPDIVSGTDSLSIREASEALADSSLSVSQVDSMLLDYYGRNRHFEFTSLNDLDTTVVRYTSAVPDSVFVQRLAGIKSFIPLTFNDVVKNYIILYSEKMPEKMGRVIGLGNYYFPIFQETFNRYDIPEELRAMAVIESMLKYDAVSRVGAKGMWQFMYQTAKKYGLVIN